MVQQIVFVSGICLQCFAGSYVVLALILFEILSFVPLVYGFNMIFQLDILNDFNQALFLEFSVSVKWKHVVLNIFSSV